MDKRLIPVAPEAVKSQVEEIISKYASQPIFCKMVGQYNVADRYVALQVEAIFSPKHEAGNVCFMQLLNELSRCGYDFHSVKESGAAVFIILFKKESK